MGEYKRPENEQEFRENFKAKKPLMNSTEAFYESSRCLFCYDAPCINSCPTHIDIPLFIRQINTGNLTGAAKTIYDANWMGNSCGIICPTEVLCEGACVYNHQGVPAIQIGRLQNHATRSVIDNKTELFNPGKSNGRKVAIIGAGPAGISCACELSVLGYEVHIYEAKKLPSGLNIYGIAPYKITNEEVLDEVGFLEKQLGFSLHYNTPITDSAQLHKLEKDYDAVFIGVGLGATAMMDIPGEELENVTGAVEFIEELRMNGHKTKVYDRVIVLGGGNTAIDAASESARMGASEITLVYRRSKEDKGAYDFEYDLALKTGINTRFNTVPVEILGNGKVEGIKLIRTESKNGKLETIDGSEFIVECDMVIKATGQQKQGHFLQKIQGLELDSRSKIIVNPENNQTTNPMYFAGGDSVNGGAEVVNAAYDGKLAANGIHIWLNQDKN